MVHNSLMKDKETTYRKACNLSSVDICTNTYSSMCWERERERECSTLRLWLTFTKRVLGANIEWASMPLRYAFTSGMPEPAAEGAM